MEDAKERVPSILLCVHGYTDHHDEQHRPWKEVIKDRLENAQKLAETFHSLGILTYLVLSGGVIRDGKVEADIIYDYAKSEFPGLFKAVTDVILERESKNTQENVDEIIKWATKKNALIVAISSKDHVSRVARDWAYDERRSDHLILVSPSKEAYSVKGWTDAPIVIEPPFWAYNALKDLFSIPEEKKEEVKRRIKEIIEKALK